MITLEQFKKYAQELANHKPGSMREQVGKFLLKTTLIDHQTIEEVKENLTEIKEVASLFHDRRSVISLNKVLRYIETGKENKECPNTR